MEHLTDLSVLSQKTGINDNKKLSLLVNYAKEIYSENKKFNLTGHKTLEDIINNLIIGSLEPLIDINVPRGTLFADIGTGSGIPGIPIAIKHDSCNGILFDSNLKKIRFINKTSSELNINNIKGVDIRVEDAARSEEYREKFDFVFTRAMSDIYTVAELGAPLLKVGGYLFLYINKKQIDYNDHVSEHIIKVGLSADITDSSRILTVDGLFLKKINRTDDMYPRRMAVIKRMATK